MPITLTIQADNFQELFTMLRDVPVGAVVRTTDPVEVVEVPVDVPTLTVPGAELDSSGTAWNAEIHSSSKAKNKDGTWRRKRGIEEDAAPAPVAPVAPVMPTTVAAPQMDYTGLMTLIGAKMQEGKMTHQHLGVMMVEHGLTNFQELIARPDLIPVIQAKVNAL